MYVANRSRYFRRQAGGRHLLSVYRTSYSLAVLYPRGCVSNVPVLSKNMYSSVPMYHTERSNFLGGIMVLAGPGRCEGPGGGFCLPGFLLRGCPGLERRLIVHCVNCGRVLSCVSRLRGGKCICIVHRGNSVEIAEAAAGCRLLGRLCSRYEVRKRGLVHSVRLVSRVSFTTVFECLRRFS